MFDTIVVGTRCAGAPLAMNLARRGYRVLAVDRSTFPSDVLSTHMLTGDAIIRLHKWGAVPRLMAEGGTPITKVTQTAEGRVFDDWLPPGAMTLAPRRTILDRVLVEMAREAGAEVREGFSFTSLIEEDGRVAGMEGRASGGPRVREHARIVVGADGRNSSVAKAVGAERYNVLPGLTGGYYTYYSGVESEGAEVHFLADRAVFLFPTNHGECCIATEWRNEDFPRLHADVEGQFEATLRELPDFWRRVQAGKRTEAFHGFRTPDNFYRKPYGPGWALVGDAGYLKDPVMGMGINDAFRDADLLTDAIDAVLSGREGFDEAMADYQRQRDEATADSYRANYERSRLAVTAASMEAEYERRFAKPAAVA